MVNLNNCKPGDKLRTVHGTILTYVGPSEWPRFPHRIMYPEGATGTRTDDGHVFCKNRLPEDEDIAEIIGQ